MLLPVAVACEGGVVAVVARLHAPIVVGATPDRRAVVSTPDGPLVALTPCCGARERWERGQTVCRACASPASTLDFHDTAATPLARALPHRLQPEDTREAIAPTFLAPPPAVTHAPRFGTCSGAA